MRSFRKASPPRGGENLQDNPSVSTESFTARIQALRAELDAHIDVLAADEAARYPNVPKAVLRNLLTRNSGCPCNAVLNLERTREMARQPAQ
jgi:hypothetical protein